MERDKVQNNSKQCAQSNKTKKSKMQPGNKGKSTSKKCNNNPNRQAGVKHKPIMHHNKYCGTPG